MKWALFLVAGIILISGCVQQQGNGQTTSIEEQAKQKCLVLCAAQSRDLSDGPCLTDNDVEFYDDWVCDVAHSPREAVDNLPENQCAEFREGRAHHFVEVNPNCEFIRSM